MVNAVTPLLNTQKLAGLLSAVARMPLLIFFVVHSQEATVICREKCVAVAHI